MTYIVCFMLTLFLSFGALGKSEQYQLKGQFKLDSSIDKPIKYQLIWSESNGEIKGTYSDNYLTKKAEVVGEDTQQGRIFKINFPTEKRGIKSLAIITSTAGNNKIATTIPVSVIVRDQLGNPLTNVAMKGELSVSRFLAQKQEEECREGFGALAGFCGIYEGLVAENVDRQNKCNLLFADSVKLELDPDGNLTLYLGPVVEIFNTPGHLIGRIPSNHGSTRIDVMSRACRSLPGIESKSDHCKRLNLTGQFSMIGVTKHFKGEYTIFDEGSKNTCSYSLSMDE